MSGGSYGGGRGTFRHNSPELGSYPSPGSSLVNNGQNTYSSIRYPSNPRGTWTSSSYTQRNYSAPTTEKMNLPQSALSEIYNLLHSYAAIRPTAQLTDLSNPFKVSLLQNWRGNDETNFATQGTNMTDQLFSDPLLNEHLHQQAQMKSTWSQFQAMSEGRQKLPAWEKQAEILHNIRNYQVVIVSGETGCGKTTQVAQFLLDEAIYSGCGSSFRAICTQPRRLAATAVAGRVAEERCEPCGGDTSSVGYQIRLEHRLPRERGSILFCTAGILAQVLQSNPYLLDVSHIILDEVHERDLMTDFLLTVLRNLLPKRPQLKVILMSATINASSFSQYFGNCPVLVIPGRTHPVQTYYLEDILIHLQFRASSNKTRRNPKLDEEYKRLIEPGLKQMEASGKYPIDVLKTLWMPESEESPEEMVLELIKFICTRESAGAILMFFSGFKEIESMYKTLMGDSMFHSPNFVILPLHSKLPTSDQFQVFVKPPEGVRKIILATNIAETSITIDDVVYVIDTGRLNQSNYDPIKNLDVVQPNWVSLANANQRTGRAGRTQPGVCFRLYSRIRESTFAPQPVAEMKKTRLEDLILRIKILMLGKVAAFFKNVPESPEECTVKISLDMLGALGALDQEERLTPLGFHLAQLPMDPLTGKMILLGAIFGCLEPILNIAAALNFKDPFVISIYQRDQMRDRKKELDGGQRSDHLLVALLMKEYRSIAMSRTEWDLKNFCDENFLNFSTMTMMMNMVDQFCRVLHERQFISSPSVSDPVANVNSGNCLLIRSLLCASMFPNIAHVKFRQDASSQQPGQPMIFTAENGRVFIHPSSINFDADNFQSLWLCYHRKVETTKIYIYDSSAVSPSSLMLFGGNGALPTAPDPRSGIVRVRVRSGIDFDCDKVTSDILQLLRSEWQVYLSYRVENPRPTDWSQGSADFVLLQAITGFVTAQDSSVSLIPQPVTNTFSQRSENELRGSMDDIEMM